MDTGSTPVISTKEKTPKRVFLFFNITRGVEPKKGVGETCFPVAEILKPQGFRVENILNGRAVKLRSSPQKRKHPFGCFFVTMEYMKPKLITTLLVGIAIISAIYFVAIKPKQQRNLIVFAFDGLQAKHLPAYGYDKDITPNLDKFLGDSYLDRNTVSPASWTVPSFMSIFTSLYPSEHKVVNKMVEDVTGATTSLVKANLKNLSPNAVTLAQILKQNGYATAGFTGDAGISAAFGHAQGFDTYYDKTTFGGLDTSVPMAKDWLSKNKDNKFFLFVHGYDVHGQYAPKEYDYRYVQKPYNGIYTGSTKEQGILREQSLANHGLSLSAEDKAFWRAIYDEKISRADAEFGDFMKYVDSLGISDNTIIAVISDHGTEFFEHNGIDHGHTLYGELLNTLFAIHAPGQTQPKTITDLVSTLDLAPTVLSMLKIAPVEAMKGVNISPSFSGTPVAHDVYSETDYRLYTHKRSITTVDGWKFIETMETGKKELYNLNTDPNEQANLSVKEGKIAYELEQKLFAHLKAMNADKGPWILGCSPVYADQCLPITKPTGKK